MTTPMKPRMIAVMRPVPTCSRRKIIDSSATASGTACITAVKLAICMCMSAVTKAMVEMRSRTLRAITTGAVKCEMPVMTPCCRQIAAMTRKAMKPRIMMISPTGRLCPMILMSVSLMTKDPMARTMKSPARRAVFWGRGIMLWLYADFC